MNASTTFRSILRQYDNMTKAIKSKRRQIATKLKRRQLDAKLQKQQLAKEKKKRWYASIKTRAFLPFH